jgi:polyisoprenoid-binding protein YceI
MTTSPNSRTVLLIVAILLAGIFSQTQAASPHTHYAIEPGSTLSLNGSSTFHDYECSATQVGGTLDGDTSGLAKNALDSVFIGAKIEVPVKLLKGTSDGITSNMQDALKGKDFPTILFDMKHCAAVPDSQKKAGVWTMKTKGNLTIAGKTQPIEMNVRLTDLGHGYFQLEGTDALLMTDYGVDPPSFMLGAMKTNPKVTINFNLKLKAQ